MHRIELHKRVRPEIAQPHPVATIDEHGVRHRSGSRQAPFPPAIRARVIHSDLARIPLADPQATLRICPHAPRALPRCRRLQDGCPAGREVDPGDVVAGQGRVVHRPARGGADAVRTAAPSCPRAPAVCAVYHPPPSAAGATSCGCEPAGTGSSRSTYATGAAGLRCDARTKIAPRIITESPIRRMIRPSVTPRLRDRATALS